MRLPLRVIRLLPALLLPALGGCAYFHNAASPQRLDGGLAIVLPGIEGRSAFNSNVAAELAEAHPGMAVEVYDWTTGYFPLMLYHLRSEDRNREQARRIAERIMRYQDAHPGRPVYLIGHSGGAGVALMTLESFPWGRGIDGAILLAAAVSRDYDLGPALCRTDRGIWNFSSPGDWELLVVGTSVAGTIDGRHAPSAGAYGFRRPSWFSANDHHLYDQLLHEVPYHFSMLTSGNLGGHFGPTTVAFTRNYLAPLLTTSPRQLASTPTAVASRHAAVSRAKWPEL